MPDSLVPVFPDKLLIYDCFRIALSVRISNFGAQHPTLRGATVRRIGMISMKGYFQIAPIFDEEKIGTIIIC